MGVGKIVIVKGCLGLMLLMCEGMLFTMVINAIMYVNDLRCAIIFATVLFRDHKVSPFLLQQRVNYCLYFHLIEPEHMLCFQVTREYSQWVLHGPCGDTVYVLFETYWTF